MIVLIDYLIQELRVMILFNTESFFHEGRIDSIFLPYLL